MPALLPLLALFLAFSLVYTIPVYTLFGALALGFFVFGLSLINRSPKLKRWLFRGALLLSLTALFGLRLTYLPDYSITDNKTIKSTCNDIRASIKTRLKASELSSETQALALAMALGHIEPNAQGQAMRRDFANSGLAHILAVSGFHLALLTALLTLLLRFLPYRGRGKLYQLLILFVVSWLFVFLTGASRPTVRAAFMLSLYLFGRSLNRPISMLNILALSLLVQLSFVPSLISSAGFWLSHMAVLSIYLFYEKIVKLIPHPRSKVLKYLWESFALTLSVQILLIPLCFYFFGGLSWSFLFTAVPVTFLASLFIPLSLLFFLCNAIGFSPFALAYSLNIIAKSITWISSSAASIDWLYQDFNLPLWGLVIYYASLGLYLLWNRII